MPRERSIVAVAGLPATYAETSYHAAKNVYAESAIADMPTPGRATVTAIRSHLGDGTDLLTTNNPLQMWHAPTTHLQECDTSDIEGMTAAHRDRRAAIDTSCNVTLNATRNGTDRAANLAAAMLPGMEQAGSIYRSAETKMMVGKLQGVVSNPSGNRTAGLTAASYPTVRSMHRPSKVSWVTIIEYDSRNA